MKTTISNELKLKFYHEMLFARRLEEHVAQLYVHGKFSGFCHLYIGQESVSVGALNAIRKGQDYVITGYRDHVMPITLGMSAGAMLAELLGKVTGCSRGKGGSMHMFSKELRFLGGHGIVGGQVPLSVGAGWKIKYKKEDLVSLCFLGDAAINQGQFYEAVNMATIWDLPCIFVVENNLYGMGTAISRTCTLNVLSDRAKGFNMRQAFIDGTNVLDVYTQMLEIIEETRKTSKPILVEIKTYRFRGHSISDPAKYRTKEEVAKAREQDCLLVLKNTLLSEKICTEADFEEFENQISTQIDEAVKFAEESSEPSFEEIDQHVFV